MSNPKQSAQEEVVREMLHEAADQQNSSALEIARRFVALEGRVGAVEVGMTENTKITSSIAKDTNELLDLFKSVKGGFKVMGWLGQFAKWFAGIAAAFAAIYAYVQSLRGH